MKKRIMSLVLALTMCLSMFTFGIVAESAPIGELLEIYKERVWDWQGYQFDAMTEEQKAVMDAAWTSYGDNADAIETVAEEFVDELLDETKNTNLSKFYGTETMKDLYKWKLMRDLMEGEIDATSDDAEYQDWLARFTAFEEANDEAISASAPMAALNGLGDYADDLTVYFGELAEMAVVDGFAFEGADADKANAYLAAYDVDGNDDMDSIRDYLVADVKELMVDGIVNNFEIGMQVATGQITRDNTTGILDMISDRDMKAAFLLVGEDLVRFVMDELVPGVRGEAMALNKKDILTAVIGDATPILGADNEAAADALYATMANLAYYMIDNKMSKIEQAEDELAKLGFVLVDEDNDIDLIESAVVKTKEAMAIIDPNHGLELVHVNTFLGRELLRYEAEGEYVYLNGAEIDGDTVTELALGFGHNRYPVFSSMNDYGIASFDANYDANGIKVYAGADIGQLVVEVAEEADGTAIVEVYRGYTDDDMDGVADYAEDVYRYVTSFTVKATSDVVVEDPYVELDDVLDTTVDGTIEVKGTTNLDYVTVAIIKNGETIYAVVYSKAEFEAGITLNAPDNAAEGDVYTVVVGTDEASASDEFAIEGAEQEYEVVLNDVLDTTVDGTITVSGTTNLDYVTVAIVKNGETIYAVVYSKAEFEAGITLNAPDNAAEGEVYTVVVGTERLPTLTNLQLLMKQLITPSHLKILKTLSFPKTKTLKSL